MRADYGWEPDRRGSTASAAPRAADVGCSASFVSERVILTNLMLAPCRRTCRPPPTTSKGWNRHSARTEEKLCPGQQAEVVTAIRDVTAKSRGRVGSARPAAVKRAPQRPRGSKRRAPTPPRPLQGVSPTAAGSKALHRSQISDVRIVWRTKTSRSVRRRPDNFNSRLLAVPIPARLEKWQAARPRTSDWAARAPVDGAATFVVGNPDRPEPADWRAASLAREVPRDQRRIFSEMRGRLISAMAQVPNALARASTARRRRRIDSKSIRPGQAIGDPPSRQERPRGQTQARARATPRSAILGRLAAARQAFATSIHYDSSTIERSDAMPPAGPRPRSGQAANSPAGLP